MALDFENMDENTIDYDFKSEVKKIKEQVIERKEKISKFSILREEAYQDRRIPDYCYYYAVIIGLEKGRLSEKLLAMPSKPESEAELRILLESLMDFPWAHSYIENSSYTVADLIGLGVNSLNALRDLQSLI